MTRPVKILVIDSNPEALYLVIGPGLFIQTTLSSGQARLLLERGIVDLVLSGQGSDLPKTPGETYAAEAA